MDTFTEFLITLLLAVGTSIAVYVSSPFLARSARVRHLVCWGIDLSARWANHLFLSLVIGYIVVFASLATLRHLSFRTGYLGVYTAWDLGQYHQLIWNSLHGRLLENSYILDAPIFLGKSFTPILLAFVPLYAVWASPIVLLIVQVLGLGFGAFPIYWFARARLGRLLALAVGTAYLLSPGMDNIGLTEFHEIALAPPLLAYTTFFLLRRHYRGMLVCLGLALLVKEEIAFIAIALGLYILLAQREWRLGLALSVFSAVWAVLLLHYVIPFFRGAEPGDFYYFGGGMLAGGPSRYSYLGRNLAEIVSTLLTRPDLVLQQVLVQAKVEYVLHLFVPLAFVPLIGIEVAVLALPTLGYSLLSTYALQWSIRSYYFAPLLPFLFFATVVGLERLLKWSARVQISLTRRADSRMSAVARKGSFLILVLVASGCSYLLQSPGPFGAYLQAERYALNERTLLGNMLLRSIPNDVVVVAQNELLAHLSNRRFIYEIPIPDYRQVDYIAADPTMAWYDVHRGAWEYYLATGYFEIVTQQADYLIARRSAPAHPLQIRFGNQMTLLGYTVVPTGTLRGGTILRPIVAWRAEQPIVERYRIALQVVDARGHVWTVEDREPHDGTLPTDQWQIGKWISDQYTLRLPPTMPTGDYQITTAVHGATLKDYLEARDEQGNPIGTEVVLTSSCWETPRPDGGAGGMPRVSFGRMSHLQ